MRFEPGDLDQPDLFDGFLDALAAALVVALAAPPTLLAAVRPDSGVWQLGVVGLFALLYFVAFKLLVGFGVFRLGQRAAGLDARCALGSANLHNAQESHPTEARTSP